MSDRPGDPTTLSIEGLFGDLDVVHDLRDLGDGAEERRGGVFFGELVESPLQVD